MLLCKIQVVIDTAKQKPFKQFTTIISKSKSDYGVFPALAGSLSDCSSDVELHWYPTTVNKPFQTATQVYLHTIDEVERAATSVFAALWHLPVYAICCQQLLRTNGAVKR